MNISTQIIFNEHSDTRLKRSFELRGLPVPDIISLNDDLRVGPLQGINTAGGNDDRREWWRGITDNTNHRDRVDPVFNDLGKLKHIKKLLADNQQICIWYGSCLLHRLMLARLIDFCGHIPENISVVPISEHEFTNIYGDLYVPKNLNVLSDENILKLEPAVRPISKDEIQKAIKLWDKVSSNNTTMRILNGNSVIFVDENYFDSALLANCKNEFVKPARVVGHTLIDSDFNVSDTILNWRLKILVSENRLEAKGILREMSDYEVRIPS